MMSKFDRAWTVALACALAACTAPVRQPEPPPKPDVTVKPSPKLDIPLKAEPTLRPAAWTELPGWRDDNVAEAWSAFLASCGVLKNRDGWRDACAAAAGMAKPSADAARAFFEQRFVPHLVIAEDGAEDGLLTGYYEPLLRGSRKPSTRYRYPVYGVPDDLVVVDLASVYPELRNMRLRGRLEGRRLVPYPDRAAIESGQAPLQGKEIAWVDDEIDLFFLQIQGSGRIQLDDGGMMRVGYADQNGRPYRSIGRLLVERGELALEQASMQGIKAWARANPAKLPELLNANGSYVFFRELPASGNGPPGSLGVPLTPGRSLAVDAQHVPLGAPVYVATTWPGTAKPLNRLMLAQDTGGAIRGANRGDFFWGFGEPAAREAGRMKQRVRMYVLLPKGLAAAK